MDAKIFYYNSAPAIFFVAILGFMMLPLVILKDLRFLEIASLSICLLLGLVIGKMLLFFIAKRPAIAVSNEGVEFANGLKVGWQNIKRFDVIDDRYGTFVKFKVFDAKAILDTKRSIVYSLLFSLFKDEITIRRNLLFIKGKNKEIIRILRDYQSRYSFN